MHDVIVARRLINLNGVPQDKPERDPSIARKAYPLRNNSLHGEARNLADVSARSRPHHDKTACPRRTKHVTSDH
jgi:hypothetical protein